MSALVLRCPVVGLSFPSRVSDHSLSANTAESRSETLISTPQRFSLSEISDRNNLDASSVLRGPSASRRSSMTTRSGLPANARANPTSTCCHCDRSDHRRPTQSSASTRSSISTARRSAALPPRSPATSHPTIFETSNFCDIPARFNHTISPPRKRKRFRSLRLVNSRSPNRTLPFSGTEIPAAIFNNVVLPDKRPPTIPTTSPRSTSNDTPLNSDTQPPPLEKPSHTPNTTNTDTAIALAWCVA